MSEKGGKFMGKRICVMAVVMLTSFCVTACNKMTKDDLVWTNENIVYAYVNAGYEDDILKDRFGRSLFKRSMRQKRTRMNIRLYRFFLSWTKTER